MQEYNALPVAQQRDIAATEGRDVANIIPLKFYSRFENKPILDPGDPTGKKYLKDENGEFKTEKVEVHWVKWGKIGDPKHGGENKVPFVRKDRELWPALKAGYEAWLRGQDAPVNGTPLEAWPALTAQEQAHALKARNIRSVEDLAQATDGDLDGIGMGARKLRDSARAFVQAKSQTVAAQIIQDSAAKVDSLEQRNADLEEQMKAMQEQLRQLTGAKPQPPAGNRKAA